MFNDLARVADCHCAVRDVLRDYRSGPDGDVVAYSDSGENSYAAPDPNVIAYCHRLGPLIPGVPFDGVGAVAGCIYAYIRSYEAVVSDRHFCLIENGQVEVGKEAFADADLLAVVTVEGLVYDEVVVCGMSEQPFQNGISGSRL